jgi:hypothetical protein
MDGPGGSGGTGEILSHYRATSGKTPQSQAAETLSGGDGVGSL